MINIIVGIITMIAAVFLLNWILRPSFRKWVEMPKYTMLRNDERFRNADRKKPGPQ
jgi:hypothetical protein